MADNLKCSVPCRSARTGESEPSPTRPAPLAAAQTLTASAETVECRGSCQTDAAQPRRRVFRSPQANDRHRSRFAAKSQTSARLPPESCLITRGRLSSPMPTYVPSALARLASLRSADPKSKADQARPHLRRPRLISRYVGTREPIRLAAFPTVGASASLSSAWPAPV
jgi:hypothetical protein